MSESRIEAALREATDTRRVVVAEGALASVAEVFEKCFGESPAAIVADENTWAVAGEEVQERLQASGRRLVEPYLFSARPTLHAEYERIEKLKEALREHEAIPVAVGSGSLNDITKRASYECERPYMVVGTAASMDGYTAFGASITEEGYKHTMSCPAPRAVVADVEVLVGAPKEMTASGYADLLGKVTAGADWIVSDVLGIEPVDPKVWSLVQGPLREWTAKPAELYAGDREAMRSLVEGLIMSGLAMQAYQSSRPASGAEHQFSHLWEMEGLGYNDEPPLSHGFKVGVGTISIAALYERILDRDLSKLDIETICGRWPTREDLEQTVREAHTPPVVENAVEESLAKYVDAQELARRLERLREVWPGLRERLKEQLIPAERLSGMLEAAGCPTSPTDIGLGWEDFEATYSRARMIRHRYTALDLAAEAGILEECVGELFAPGGFWANLRASCGL